MRRLSGFERRWFQAMVETILPSGASEQFPLGGQDVPLQRFLADFLRHAPLKIVVGLRATLLMIFLAPLFMSGMRRTFMALGVERREAAILRMRHSDVYVIRELPVLLKTIGCMAVLGVPEVQRSLGMAQVDTCSPDWVGDPGPEDADAGSTRLNTITEPVVPASAAAGS